MKILFLHLTAGLVSRGSEISTDLLATQLSRHHSVLLIQAGPASPKPYQVKRVYPLTTAPPVAPTSILDKLLFRLGLDENSRIVARFTKSAIPTIKRFAPDIIVAVNGAPQLSILQGQALQAKLVVFGRAGIGHHDLSTLKAGPDLFIALSTLGQTWAAQHALGQTKISYLPNPINFVKSKPADLHLLEPVVMTVSALSRYKNIPAVIQAVAKVQTSFLLVGDGEESGAVAAALSKLGTDFRWIKQATQAELASYYQAANVFCFLPDPQEAFGRVYLEAMWAGLPIVASDDPVRRELIGEQGIYVHPHDKEAVVAALRQAITLGKLDYTKQLKPYTLSTVVKQLEQLFYDLLN